MDEAGRGPVIGPMVLCLYGIEEDKTGRLEEIGVKDSKKLSPRRREVLLPHILALSDILEVEVVSPQEIDGYPGSLNELEARKIADMLNRVENISVVYVDSPDPKEENFARRIARYLERPVKIVAEHGADARYPVVSAASIVAKVLRDMYIREIEREYGPVGSGYPHDPKTVEFLKRYLRDKKGLPPVVRRKWETVKKAGQTTLEGYT